MKYKLGWGHFFRISELFLLVKKKKIQFLKELPQNFTL